MQNIKAISGSEQPDFLMIMNTMGESVLIETLKMATYYVSHSNIPLERKSFKRWYDYEFYRDSKRCYAYIQGTGINIIIQKFALPYDSEMVRNNFNFCVRRS